MSIFHQVEKTSDCNTIDNWKGMTNLLVYVQPTANTKSALRLSCAGGAVTVEITRSLTESI